MDKITSREIRSKFLGFMKQKGHLQIPGASIIPKNDPSLLFINAGMAPMKAYFSGQERPPQSDLCNVQPCIRTIDIDDVILNALGAYIGYGLYKILPNNMKNIIKV
jgi:alanyl-tRNA synthetase